MNKTIYEKAKANVSKTLGVSNFSEAARKTGVERDKMISEAQKRIKVKTHTKIRNLSSGNPYIMLGRKVSV